MVGHRSSLASALFSGRKSHPAVKFHFSTSISHIESFMPRVIFSVQPRHGSTYTLEADVLLAADGVKSNTRSQILWNLASMQRWKIQDKRPIASCSNASKWSTTQNS
jgi:salicylate hydroxylase